MIVVPCSVASCTLELKAEIEDVGKTCCYSSDLLWLGTRKAGNVHAAVRYIGISSPPSEGCVVLGGNFYYL